MNGPNGHAQTHSDSTVHHGLIAPHSGAEPTDQRLPDEKIRQLVAELEVPFEGSCIEWRVTNTWSEGKRGQIVPYANPRAYTDRLNALVTPAGWTRNYTVSTSANFERAKDKKLVAKVLVTCELTIFGLGTHSATGEEWADSEFACTAAEAQSFKRAASCFGLGRYLYYFTGVWVDLDDHKRPKHIPQLFSWATPDGWRKGLRPTSVTEPGSNDNQESTSKSKTQSQALLAEIELMAQPLGRGLFRGVLRDIARVWNPRDIQDVTLQQRVLEHMRAAERGLRRLEVALDKTRPEELGPILRSLGFSSLERVDTLDALKKIVLEVERLVAQR